MPTTRVAYYADVRWGGRSAARTAAAAAVPAPSGRARRTASHPSVDVARDDARRKPPTRSSRLRWRPRAVPAAAGREAVPRAPGARPAARPEDVAAARRLVRQLYRRADHVAVRSSVPAPGARRSASHSPTRSSASSSAGSRATWSTTSTARTRRRCGHRSARRLLQDPPPRVIVAHSLGTIILYDVLSEPAWPISRVDVLVTVGCPLGIGNVQNRLRDARRPSEPGPASAWGVVQLRRPVRSGGASTRPSATSSSRELRPGRRGQQRRPQQPRPDRISADRARSQQDRRRFRSVTRRPARPG